jgi:DNA invertase Pin-like site-specific DNA recombinase
MKTAVLYACDSPRPKENEPIKDQMFELRAWCDRNGVKILSQHKDELKAGGKVQGRYELRKAVREARESKSTLIVYTLSRVAAALDEAIKLEAELREAGASIKTHTGIDIDTSTLLGRKMFGFVVEIGDYFHKGHGGRPSSVMAHLQRQGRRIGSFVPTGWMEDINGPVNKYGRPAQMVPNWDERRAVVYAKYLRQRKHTIKAIIKAINAKYPYRGGNWAPTTVRNLLTKPLPYDEMSVKEINEAIEKENT